MLDTATPEWAKTEQSIEAAKVYLRRGGTIDLFELVVRKILLHKPTDLAAFSYELIANMRNGDEAEAEPVAPQPLSDTRYMEDAKVSEFVDRWVLALLQQRPSSDVDLLEFHKSYLASLMSGKEAE